MACSTVNKQHFVDQTNRPLRLNYAPEFAYEKWRSHKHLLLRGGELSNRDCVIQSPWFVTSAVGKNTSACKVVGYRSKGGSIEQSTLSDYHFILGEILSLEGDLENAVENLKLASLYSPQSDIYYRLAELNMDLSNIETSITNTKKALKLNQNSGKALVLLGNLYAMKGNSDEAKEALLSAIDKKEYTAFLYLSVLYEKQGDLANSIKVLKSSLELSPSTTHIAHYKLGNLYLHYSPVLAKKHYTLAIEKNWDFVPPVLSLHDMYKSEGNLDEAINILSGFQSVSDKNPEISLKLANLYLAKKRLPDAYDEFSFIYNTMPYNLVAPTKMGLILIEQKKYEEAAKIFNQILDVEPNSDSIKYYLGAVYEELNLPTQAVNTFLEITRDSSYYEEAMLHATHLSSKMDNKPRAFSILENLLKTHPSLQAKILYTNLLGEQGDYAKAILILNDALTEFENNIDLFYALGSMHDIAGEKNKTIEYMNSILELDPNNVAALNYTAYTYSELSINLDTAQRLALRALRLSPEDGYIKDTLGWILYKKGRLQDAIVILESAYELEPDESIIADHLADAYHKNNQIEKATAMYEKAMELETNEKILNNIKAKLAKLKENNQPTNISNKPTNQDYKIISAN